MNADELGAMYDAVDWMEVYDAVECNNVPLLTKLVASGPAVDHVTEEGLTPLIRALQLHDEASVLILLERAMLNWFTDCATSPLATAVQYYPEMVPILIGKGASLCCYISPITAAVNANDPTMLQYLLSNGSPINGGDIPPLHQAVMNSNLSMVELVLAKGAFVDWQDSSGATPLLLAASKDDPNLKVIEVLLVRQANIEIGNLQGITPLVSAAGYGDAEIVDLLLRYDADVGHTTNKGITPLHAAVCANSMVCAHMLMSQGADVNAVDVVGVTPLMMAFRYDISEDMVTLLLDMNANVNIVASNGLTALFQAISNDKVGTVETLLCHGARINHPLTDGTTPLHSAVFHQNGDMVDLLLQHDASGDLSMMDGTAPIHTATRLQNMGIVERLLEHGCSQGGALHIAAEIGACEHAKLLLRYKADINATDRGGIPPIKYAVENEHVEVTILLVSAGALFSVNQIKDFTQYKEWALMHLADLNALAMLVASPTASSVVGCDDLKNMISTFLLLPNVTALALRVEKTV